MALFRLTPALVLPFLMASCSVAGPRPGTPFPDPDEAVDAGSAALEEAGLADAPDPGADVGGERAPEIDFEEAEATPVPGAFLYPASGELPDTIQRQVERFVHAFTEGNARTNFRTWLEREAVWGDWIRGELRAAGLPEELVYLAMIESGFHPTIVSHAGATGMWQFMAPTARMSGLRVDGWVDERRDPEAATRAAIRHLSELYQATGDWALSAAAYNAGLGRVTRARAAAGDGAKDYFGLSLAERLPRETRNYVPIMLAAAYLDAHRAAYGLPERVAGSREAVDTVRVDGRTRLSALAAGSGVAHDELKRLNAHLVRGALPPEGGTLRVPAATDTSGLATYLAGLSREQRLLPDWIESHYAVRSGDSWWRIARNHDTTVDRLRALNPKRGDVIHPGDRLVVRRVAAYDTVRSTATAAGSE